MLYPSQVKGHLNQRTKWLTKELSRLESTGFTPIPWKPLWSFGQNWFRRVMRVVPPLKPQILHRSKIVFNDLWGATSNISSRLHMYGSNCKIYGNLKGLYLHACNCSRMFIEVFSLHLVASRETRCILQSSMREISQPNIIFWIFF